MNNDFDKNLTEFFQNEAAISSTRNIGEEAILQFIKNKENDIMIKNKISVLKLSPRRFAAVIFCIILFIGGTIATSADMRNSISELIQTIFTIEKQDDSYVVVEKNADEEITANNYGGIPIDQFSTNDLINKLGFEPFFLETIGSNSKISAEVGIQLNGKSSDLLSLRNSLKNVYQCIKDDSVFNSMKKYDPVRYLAISYSENGDIYDKEQIFLHMSKITTQRNYKKIEPISDFDYKGIKCSYIDDVRPDYQKINSDGWIYDDETMKPNGIIHLKHITFNLDEVNYSVSYVKNIKDTNSFNEFNYDEVEQFVKGYIDAYMSK